MATIGADLFEENRKQLLAPLTRPSFEPRGLP